MFEFYQPMTNGKRHKVFVSYHHANDQYYRDQLERLCINEMVSRSVQLGDIDPNLHTETIYRRIRDEYLRDSTVTVVLIGRETWKRKYVDWEISSSIRETKYNSRSGLLGIILPSYPRYPYYDPYTIPPRLYRNIECGFAKIYPWSNNPHEIQNWIHEAFQRRKIVVPDNSARLFARNRPEHQLGWQP